MITGLAGTPRYTRPVVRRPRTRPPTRAALAVAALTAFYAALSYSDTPSAVAPAAGKVAKATRGVVVLELKGQVLGLGTILGSDGRILTALSLLGAAREADVRYPDGSVVHGQLEREDPAWDLALLVPATRRAVDGLAASEADPLHAGAKLEAFTVVPKGQAQRLPVVVKGHKTLLASGDVLLRDALELSGRITPRELGSPVLDEAGGVLAVVARACQPVETGPCTPVPFGAPVDAIRRFLRGAAAPAATSTAPAPWLGAEVVADAVGVARGVRVRVVRPESPADDAHLRGGGNRATADLIVAVDGLPVTSPEALAEAVRARVIGQKVDLLVFGEGKFRQVWVVLAPAPGRESPRGGAGG